LAASCWRFSWSSLAPWSCHVLGKSATPLLRDEPMHLTAGIKADRDRSAPSSERSAVLKRGGCFLATASSWSTSRFALRIAAVWGYYDRSPALAPRHRSAVPAPRPRVRQKLAAARSPSWSRRGVRSCRSAPWPRSARRSALDRPDR
jgi:hypothetical protein